MVSRAGDTLTLVFVWFYMVSRAGDTLTLVFLWFYMVSRAGDTLTLVSSLASHTRKPSRAVCGDGGGSDTGDTWP